MKNLNIFGCKAYVFVHKEQRKKLDNKADKMMFVGYLEESRGYRFLDKTISCMRISRNVVFLIKIPKKLRIISYTVKLNFPSTINHKKRTRKKTFNNQKMSRMKSIDQSILTAVKINYQSLPRKRNAGNPKGAIGACLLTGTWLLLSSPKEIMSLAAYRRLYRGLIKKNGRRP